MTSSTVLERDVVIGESAIVRPGKILRLETLEAAVGPKDKRFKTGWLPCAKFLGKTYCCIAEEVQGVKGYYRVMSHFLNGTQPETCRAIISY